MAAPYPITGSASSFSISLTPAIFKLRYKMKDEVCTEIISPGSSAMAYLRSGTAIGDILSPL
jgi:hypothetical protein